MKRLSALKSKLLCNSQLLSAREMSVVSTLPLFSTTTEARNRTQTLSSHLPTCARQSSICNNTKLTCQRRTLFTMSRTLYNPSESIVNKEAATNEFANTAQSNNNNSYNENSGASALDVAMQVNKIKRLHQTGGSADSKKQLELEAWGLLNALTDEQINKAEGKAVSLLLNSWAYFAKYWENGKDGPAVNQSKAEQVENKLEKL